MKIKYLCIKLSFISIVLVVVEAVVVIVVEELIFCSWVKSREKRYLSCQRAFANQQFLKQKFLIFANFYFILVYVIAQ